MVEVGTTRNRGEGRGDKDIFEAIAPEEDQVLSERVEYLRGSLHKWKYRLLIYIERSNKFLQIKLDGSSGWRKRWKQEDITIVACVKDS